MGIYSRGRPKKYSPSTGKGQEPPSAPGEYRIRDEKGKIVYIGEASNLKQRMKQHLQSGKLKKD